MLKPIGGRSVLMFFAPISMVKFSALNKGRGSSESNLFLQHNA